MSIANSNWKRPVTRSRLVVAVILIVGWTIAAAVYVGSPPPAAEDAEIDEMEHTKKYLRDVEIVGGKAAVFTSELNAWLASLWEGRRRAYTIAFLTVAVAGAYVLLERAGRPIPGDDESASHSSRRRT